MFTDSAALAIALAASRDRAAAPADHERTFGYYRFEILAAALNAAAVDARVGAYVLLRSLARASAIPLRDPVHRPCWRSASPACGEFPRHAAAARRRGNQPQHERRLPRMWSDMLGSWVSSPRRSSSSSAAGSGRTLWSRPAIAPVDRAAVLDAPARQPAHPAGRRAGRPLVPRDRGRSYVRCRACRTSTILHVWALTSGGTALRSHLVLEDGAAQEPVLQAAARMLAERLPAHPHHRSSSGSRTASRHSPAGPLPRSITRRLPH